MLIRLPYVFMAAQVVIMQIMFITIPALMMIMMIRKMKMKTTLSHFIMSLVFIVLAPKTIAFGAVATGSMKAYEHVTAARSIR